MDVVVITVSRRLGPEEQILALLECSARVGERVLATSILAFDGNQPEGHQDGSQRPLECLGLHHDGEFHEPQVGRENERLLGRLVRTSDDDHLTRRPSTYPDEPRREDSTNRWTENEGPEDPVRVDQHGAPLSRVFACQGRRGFPTHIPR